MHALTDDVVYDAPTLIDPVTRSFNPTSHMVDLKGKSYLPVAARIAWLRAEHPDADITTTPIRIDDEIAIFAAHIAVPGRGSATDHGSETPAHFPDFIEKSETKAIGRALAALGFGTQHAADLDEGTRVADAPVTRPSGNGYRPAETYAAMGTGTISPKQLAFARQLVTKLGIDDEALAASLQREYGVANLADVGRADASGLIDRLKAKADALAAGGR